MPEVILFFPKRGKEKEHWFCHIWIARWLKFFLENIFFFDFGHIRGKWGGGVKVGLKVQTLGPSCFC